MNFIAVMPTFQSAVSPVEKTGARKLTRFLVPMCAQKQRAALHEPHAVTPTFQSARLPVGKPALRSTTGSWPRFASNLGG